MTSAATIIRALGGRNGVCCCPVPSHGKGKGDRRPSLKVTDDPRKRDGIDVVCFAGCDWRDVKVELERLRLLPELGGAARFETPRRSGVPNGHVTEPDKAERTRRALRPWHDAHHIGSAAAGPLRRYLEIRCGGIPDDVLTSDALRFHPACPFKVGEGRQWFPAMVGLFCDIRTDEPVAIHRTALRPDGSGKADMPTGAAVKQMLGPVSGAAIMLSPPDAVTYGLGVTEGAENAVSVLLTGWRPVWALGSAGAIRNFPFLGGIEALTIFADADDAGWNAAQACGERLAAEGVEVRVLAPPGEGEDWNDRLGRLA